MRSNDHRYFAASDRRNELRGRRPVSAADLLFIASAELAAVRAENRMLRDALEAIEDMAQFKADSAYWLPVIRALARKILEKLSAK
jgi:hypothetical protein